MEIKKTVFVLGAGASKTYGFPLGDELRRSIIRNYGNIISVLARNIKNVHFLSNSIIFREHFEKSGDKSIDLFLSKFPQHSEAGIIAILFSILSCENKDKFLDRLYHAFHERKELNLLDDWMWYLYNRLTRNMNLVKTYEEIDFSKISFITFNYDRSLEYFFYDRLENGFNYEIVGGSAAKVMETLNIEHVYGKVCPLPWQDKEANTIEYGVFNVDKTDLRLFSGNIKLIGQRTEKNMETIHNLIKDAQNIFFLGFSYDETNLGVLGIPRLLSLGQRIYGTAIGYLDEEIEEIETHFYQKNRNFPGVHKHDLFIKNIDCTTLLRKYFRGS